MILLGQRKLLRESVFEAGKESKSSGLTDTPVGRKRSSGLSTQGGGKKVSQICKAKQNRKFYSVDEKCLTN